MLVYLTVDICLSNNNASPCDGGGGEEEEVKMVDVLALIEILDSVDPVVRMALFSLKQCSNFP